MEYPGYSYYRDRPSSEANIFTDAKNLIKFLEVVCNVHKENILLFGRSLGTGICCELGSNLEDFYGAIVKI